MSSHSLQNKKIIISAGASGIGWATTKVCVAKGASVYLWDIDLKAIKKVKKHPLYNKRIFVSEADASDEIQVIDFFDKIKKKFKNLDALINNVGIEGPTRPIEKLDSNEWENTLHVNVNSHFYFTKQAIPLLKKSKNGSIINISSVAGRVVYSSGSVYWATKHAVTAFSEGLRQEFSARANIRVTCIEPGVVETELLNTNTDESLQSFIETAKKSQGLKAEDIAEAILFAVQSPEHMNVNEILVRPTTQER